MSKETRPSSHDERDLVITAVLAYFARPDADPTVLTRRQVLLDGPQAAYKSARDAYREAQAMAKTASEAAHSAETPLDAAFRTWNSTVSNSKGISVPSDLASMLGGVLPSDFMARTLAEKLTRLDDLFLQVGVRTGLAGDATRLASLKAAVEVCRPLVVADAQAIRARKSRGTELTRATEAFDAAYMAFLKAFRGIVGEAAAAEALPLFIRFKRTQKTAEPTVMQTK